MGRRREGERDELERESCMTGVMSGSDWEIYVGQSKESYI